MPIGVGETIVRLQPRAIEDEFSVSRTAVPTVLSVASTLDLLVVFANRFCR